MTPARICFATPIYRSDPRAALTWAKYTALALGQGSAGFVMSDCAWIDVARTLLVRAFLDSESEFLLFRDQDIWVEPELVARLLEPGAPMVVAPYSVRGEPSRFETVFAENGSNDGAGDVSHCGLGCALIRRDVLELLWGLHREDLHFMQYGQELVNLFDRLFVERDNGRQLFKEDRAFCYRVRSAGFPIRALSPAKVDHDGQVTTFWKPEQPRGQT